MEKRQKIRTLKCEVPHASAVKDHLPADYSDCFLCSVAGNSVPIAPSYDIIKGFFTDMPGWIDALFRLRNFLVKPVGLRTGKENGTVDDLRKAMDEGKDFGFMKFEKRTFHDTVISMNDKHLIAYMGVYTDEKEDGKADVYLSSVVRYHNRLGRLYFNAIRPFHKMVVKGMIRYALRKSPS